MLSEEMESEPYNSEEGSSEELIHGKTLNAPPDPNERHNKEFKNVI
jgi:hypothetical protein